MNRFDKNFNGSDPETARPFSGGHPDGAWMISIVYGYILFFSVIGFIVGMYKSVTGESIQWAMIIGPIISWILFVPPIKFIFARSANALFWCLGLLVIFTCAFIGTLFSNPGGAAMLGVIALIQAYICFYLYTLLKDKLLFKDSEGLPNTSSINSTF